MTTGPEPMIARSVDQHPTAAGSSHLRVAVLVVFANVLGLILFLQGSANALLSAVVDPLHPDRIAMEQAFTGFTVYAVSLLGVAAIAGLALLRIGLRRVKRPAASRSSGSSISQLAVLAIALTAAVVLVFVEVLIFRDYGVHFYEFDVVGILADAALRRDLGIQPAEVVRVTLAAIALLAAELALCFGAIRLAQWRGGAIPRACGAAMLLFVPGGLALFQGGEDAIASDRAEFVGALPLGKQLLFRATERPFIDVRPRLGASGYPVLEPADAAPRISDRRNIVLFVADGLRGDMIRPELTPNLLAFGTRSDVVHSRRHYSSGHVSESGIFGLLYGLEGQAFHSFIQARVPSYPIEILRRNGYHTLLLASSRLSPYPSDQLLKVFDEVAYPRNDDDAIEALEQYVSARRDDGRPYFVLAFFYTPHYPFTSAKPHLRKYPMVGPRARTNYMNDVLQVDDYFRQTFAVVETDFARGKTILIATSDHGEEIRDHGVFGHAPATFWNEKIVVPFFLGLPGRSLPSHVRRPNVSSHADLWPTVLEYLEVQPLIAPERYSDGHSLLRADESSRPVLVTGRFFPYADRPSVLVDAGRKYWFRVTDVGAQNRLCVVVTRITDLGDRPVAIRTAVNDARMVASFESLQSTFWRFIEPAGTGKRDEMRVC